MRIGLLHPGEMGAAAGFALRTRGHEVLWASAGRAAETRERALRAGFVEVPDVEQLAARAELVLSICPPHAALDVARQLEGFDGIYVDANAVAPTTVRAIGQTVRRLVDGAIIGLPPVEGVTARMYLSGCEAGTVAELFDGTPMHARVVSTEAGAASAVKMAYASWNKGSAALLLAARSAAARAGVEAELVEEWGQSQPQLLERVARAQSSAAAKGWRWVGEMEQVAQFFADLDLPQGFHRAAAEIYGQFPREQGAPAPADLPGVHPTDGPVG